MDKVKLELNNGKAINLELFREYAPESVDNFLDLVKSGFYDGLCFHRVIEGFMIQYDSGRRIYSGRKRAFA